MAFDIIVFNQTELNDALSAGIKHIALCDNSFSLPGTDDVEYTFIGDVTVDGGARKSEKSETNETVSSYASSYASSHASSYKSSYTTSYVTSYLTSYVYKFGSFYAAGSGVFSSSGSFGGSYFGSYAPLEDIIEFGSSGIIFVNGYGINLI